MSSRDENVYCVFGGVLRSSVELPELHMAPAHLPEAWNLVVRDGEPQPSTEFELTSSEALAGGVSVQLHSRRNGDYRMSYSDTGTFDISDNGRCIEWYRPTDVRDDLARTDILGRVLALAAHSQQLLTLHASAVSLDEGVVGFLAPKFYGKSTLACALTDAGARLVTDDALAIRAGDVVECAPGVPAIRLRSESASHLRGAAYAGVGDNLEWRHLDRRGTDEVMDDWRPVAALYVLQPQRANTMSVPATRELLSPAEAAISVIRFAKLGALLRGTLALDYLDRATRIAGRIPVYTMRLTRDLDRLDDVASQVAEWHRE